MLLAVSDTATISTVRWSGSVPPDHHVAPLDQEHAVCGRGRELQVVELRTGPEPVHIGVDQREEAFMPVYQDETRAGDLVVDTEPVGDTGGEHGLACAEATGEKHDIGRAEEPGEPAADSAWRRPSLRNFLVSS